MKLLELGYGMRKILCRYDFLDIFTAEKTLFLSRYRFIVLSRQNHPAGRAIILLGYIFALRGTAAFDCR